MSRHRRTKSSGDYFTSHCEVLIEELTSNETQCILQNIQLKPILHQQIVEKIDDVGIYNSLFQFGRNRNKIDFNANLSVISEASHSTIELPEIKHRKNNSQTIQVNKPLIRHNHSMSQQLSQQQLENF